MNLLRVFLLCATTTLTLVISACGLSGHEQDAESSGAGAAGTGSTGSGDDANIAIGPDAEPPDDAYHPYAYLCGDGCKPGGDSTECAADPSGSGGSGGGTAGQELVCQLVPGQGSATPVCGPAGPFGVDGPCQSASDCAEGLGCAATEVATGACRTYCCGHVEDCAPGTYCAPRPMQEATEPASGEARLLIPVCIPADNCELLADSCRDGLTCTIVRANGTTSCVEPGSGGVGDACPCAAGFVCSQLTNQCKKLCHLKEDVADCGAGATCQGGSMGYPPGFGICVGGDY